MVRLDSSGRNVSDLPGLWSEDDCEIVATNFNHPSITEGQHTNGPAGIWVRRPDKEWICTGLHQMHKVIRLLTDKGIEYFERLAKGPR